jgi:GTP-binding protein
MFFDQAKIYVKSGDGGHGCVSLHREKFIPKGGPDGGDGGYGGHVYFVAVDDLDTLIDFNGKQRWIAKSGLPGEGNNRHGAEGDDLIIRVPVGTMLFDMDLDDLMIKDLTEVGVKVRVCKGGKGGKGNKSFANAIRQTPRFATNGKIGQSRNLRLELKLIADVGLLGMPNAGKSTLVSRCSAARPKIADYPFTTLEPVLGIVELSGYRRYVMADIPGIIEGAHDGVGLGLDFLRHIERTNILLHVLDAQPMDGSDPVDNYHTLRNELDKYSPVLAAKPEVIVLNKIDLAPDSEIIEDITSRLGKKKVHTVSAVSGQGLRELNEALWQQLNPTEE